MKKWSKKKKGVVIAAGVVLLGLAGTYGYQVSVYQNHFLPEEQDQRVGLWKNDSKRS